MSNLTAILFACLILLLQTDHIPEASVAFLSSAGDRLAENAFTPIQEPLAASELSVMEALELVKNRYAANFEKVFTDQESTKEEYYYKLPSADYYLVYEGQGKTKRDYLFHLYEFVMDEPDLGIGHTVTYGWYTVDKETGIIAEQMQ